MISFHGIVDYHSEFTMFVTFQIDFGILHQANPNPNPNPDEG